MFLKLFSKGASAKIRGCTAVIGAFALCGPVTVPAIALPLPPAPVPLPVPARTTEPVTFWGKPYPYGYAYVRPQPKCWVSRRVETPNGWRIEEVWVCGEVVTSRY
jgi:hypothetical protein